MVESSLIIAASVQILEYLPKKGAARWIRTSDLRCVKAASWTELDEDRVKEVLGGAK